MLVLFVLACALPPSSPEASFASADTASADTASADTSADTAAACPPLRLAPASVELPPATTVEIAVEGCATGLTVVCPPWADLELADPAAPGDVARVSSVIGWSGDRSGACRVTWAGGLAGLHVELVTR